MSSTSLPDSTGPQIIVKAGYLKILFLIDRARFEGNPIFKRRIRRANKEIDVYDSSLFYTFTQFGPIKPPFLQWRFTSSEGAMDALQIYPFDSSTIQADPAKQEILQSDDRIIIPKTDSLVVVTHDYNGFQRGKGEWAGVRADENCAELRLVVDFSSVITIPGKEDELFGQKPSGNWVHNTQKDPRNGSKLLEELLPFEFHTDRIFSIVAHDVVKGDVLRLQWRMAWENLARWDYIYSQESKKETFTPLFK